IDGGGSFMGLLAQAYFPAVIFARFVQGSGASAVPALILVIITRYVRPEGRGKAFGIVGSLVAMGEGIGPAIGGMIDCTLYSLVVSVYSADGSADGDSFLL
ncbi:MFS transporter, partial [Brevibacillus borstelensis]|uniref:MFS transporter n=1 Tax=Brevibacillus borstelensis TaxID=45462 RepID=UPI003CF4558F